MISDIPLDSDEKLLLRITRTSIWLVGLYLLAGLVFVGLLVVIFLIAKNQASVAEYMPLAMALLIALAGSVLLGMLIYIAIKVYRGNVMFLTNERLVLLTQANLFHQTVPQINLGDVQEVTVTQHGFLSHLFSYGTIVIETAGEQKNIILRFASNPHYVVQQIDDASEIFKSVNGNI